MKNLPDWLYLWTSRALIGMIPSSCRAIAVDFDDNRKFTLRMYMDREVIDDDYEVIDEIMTLILSNISSNSDIVSILEEVIYTVAPMKNLSRLGGFVYARLE